MLTRTIRTDTKTNNSSVRILHFTLTFRHLFRFAQVVIYGIWWHPNTKKPSISTPQSQKCNTSSPKSEKGSVWTPQSHFSNTLSLKKAKLRKKKSKEVAHEHHLWKPSIWTPQSQKCNTSEIDSEHTEHCSNPKIFTEDALGTPRPVAPLRRPRSLCCFLHKDLILCWSIHYT